MESPLPLQPFPRPPMGPEPLPTHRAYTVRSPRPNWSDVVRGE